MVELSTLKKGQIGEVSGINLTGKHLKRMVELGFVKGTMVRIEALAPRCKTILVSVRGYTLALSEDVCKSILVENIK